MKNFVKSILLILILSLSIPMTATAHSGRTDSNGGHRDNKNVSGLGSYHYHCGGYPAHLHQNGICPYKSQSQSQSTSLTPTISLPQEQTSITDIKAYINDTFIPSFNYKNNTFIIAEDLDKYGYDVIWEGENRTLKIVKNLEKKINSNSSSNPSISYKIKTTDIKTQIFDVNLNRYKDIDSYNIDGQTIIRIDTIGDLCTWDSDNRTINVN